MAERPDASTPRQTESWSDCKGVYRLFQRPEVTFESVTAVHYQRTRDLGPGTYLVPQITFVSPPRPRFHQIVGDFPIFPSKSPGVSRWRPSRDGRYRSSGMVWQTYG